MMRYTAGEKYEIIRLVEEANLPARRVLDELQIPRSSFYRWLQQYNVRGLTGLEDHTRGPGRIWNKLPEEPPITLRPRPVPSMSSGKRISPI